MMMEERIQARGYNRLDEKSSIGARGGEAGVNNEKTGERIWCPGWGSNPHVL